MEFVEKNAINNLGKIVKNNVLFFTQPSIYNIFGNIINDQLKSAKVTLFDKISENPKRDEILSAQNLLKNQNFDYIVAFGGGSVIDFAKAFRFYDERETPLVAIPTTAGTGSQTTQFAVVYINGVKNSLDNPKILPDFVIADSQFVESAPRYLKACSAIDAFCQAIESFWAVGSTDESKKYALEAIEICRDYLESAVNSADEKANEMMVKAAHLAGKAINISRTTASHALSYKITSQYGIPHGHAVALSLANLLSVNSQISENTCKDPRGYLFVKNSVNTILKTLKCNNDNEFKNYWNKLLQNIGLESSLNKLNIEDFENIANSVNVQRLGNNPYALSKDDLLKILEL